MSETPFVRGSAYQLDPVQIAARKAAEGKRGYAWFLQQRLGKTLTALTEFLGLANNGGPQFMIVVCPATFRSGWIDEIEKHGLNNHFNAHVFQSAKKEVAWRWLMKGGPLPMILIVNYDAIRIQAVMLNLLQLMRSTPTYLVFDESISIASHNTQQTKAALMLAPAAAAVRIMTGKPQRQGPNDLWAQLRAIGMLQGFGYYPFRGRYCVMGGWENKEVVGAKNADELAKLIEPNVFQARREHWAPTASRKNFIIHDYELSDEQRRQYQQMEHEFLLALENGDYVSVDVAVAKYEKLAQILCGFIIHENGDITEIVPPAKNARLKALREIIDEADDKVTIVYRHRYCFEILNRELAHLRPAHIKGGMNPEEVSEQKRRFNTDPNCRAMLTQIRAGKYGHALTGTDDDRCGLMVFFENSYSLDDREQIEDRPVTRRGDVIDYFDLCGSALDRDVCKALQRKEKIFQAVFGKVKIAVPA